MFSPRIRKAGSGPPPAQQKAAPFFQPKLTVNAPGDQYEQEADAMAQRVAQTPPGKAVEGADAVQRQPQAPEEEPVQRKCAECEQKEKERVQRQEKKEEEKLQRQPEREEEQGPPVQTKPLLRKKAGGGYTATPALHARIAASKGTGTSLPAPTRARMQSAFGVDFGQVRIHTDSRAADLNAGINARAFTHGSDIYFNRGEYAPESGEGRKLLAHELTHVVQQGVGINNNSVIMTSDKRFSSLLQCSLQSDIREESGKTEENRTHGRLGLLETQARNKADAIFQEQTGNKPLPEGATGKATQVINHIEHEIIRLETARALGYQQAVSNIIGELTLNKDQAASFWLAFSGNTIWALSGLIPLLGPVIGVSKILSSRGKVKIIENAVGKFLKVGGGNVASSIVGLTGAEMAQFSGDGPASGSTLPRTMEEVQRAFTKINTRIMSRYRIEAFAFTLDFLENLDKFIDPSSRPVPVDFLENFSKGCIMETLFADLSQQKILNKSNYTINTEKAQESAKRNLIDKITDVWFTNQVESIGLGARPGVLQIELASDYPYNKKLKIQGGNIVGEGSDIDLMRERLANRPLKEITIPKVIRMNGNMGWGLADCFWNINVTGQDKTVHTKSKYQAYTATEQHVVSYAGHPTFGYPWLAAFHFGLNDLSSKDSRNTATNRWAGAHEIWDAIKDSKIGSIGNSSW